MEGRKVVQFRDLQNATIKSATAVMEIAAVIIKETLTYLTKLSREIGLSLLLRNLTKLPFTFVCESQKYPVLKCLH